MSLQQLTRWSMTLMVTAFFAMFSMVARAATFPTADDIAGYTSTQLLAWAVVIEAGVIVAMAGVIVQAYRNRVRSMEKQIEACRACASEIARAMEKRG